MNTARTQVLGSVITPDVDDSTLAAAKAGDRDAGASILAHLETRLTGLARRSAKIEAEDEGVDYTEDLIQEASLIAWECLVGYEGETLDAFRAYVFRYVERELPARARNMINGTGDDTDGKKLFAQMVKHFRAADPHHRLSNADYLDLAERAVQDRAMVAMLNGGAYKRRVRMSPEAAYAARLAYQGTVSIHRPVGDGEDQDVSLADTLVGQDSVEDQADTTVTGIRPVQWVVPVRILEAELPLPADAEKRTSLLAALDRFRTGTVLEEDLELVESLPCRSAQVGQAVAMLRSLFVQAQAGPARSTAEDNAAKLLGRGSVALNAQRAAQERALDRVVQRLLVRKVMGMLSPRQAYILAATFGFVGEFRDDAQVAEEMAKAGIADIDAARVRKDRDKAKAAFAKKWADLVAKTGSERAALDVAVKKAEAAAAKAEAQGIVFLTDLQKD